MGVPAFLLVQVAGSPLRLHEPATGPTPRLLDLKQRGCGRRSGARWPASSTINAICLGLCCSRRSTCQPPQYVRGRRATVTAVYRRPSSPEQRHDSHMQANVKREKGYAASALGQTFF